jgi:hypothetical protein
MLKLPRKGQNQPSSLISNRSMKRYTKTSYFCVRDTSEAGKISFDIDVNRIDCRFRHDSCTAYRGTQLDGLSEGDTIRLWRIRAHCQALLVNLYERSFIIPTCLSSSIYLSFNLTGVNLGIVNLPGAQQQLLPLMPPAGVTWE